VNGCRFAFDNECDETRYGGGGYCAAGSDTADCAMLAAGLADDSCRWANDNECDEPRYGGTGACTDGTDTSDCQGSGAVSTPIPDSPPVAAPPTGVEPVAPQGRIDQPQTSVPLPAPTPPEPPAPTPPATAAARLGNDSCQYALDGRCDEPEIGTALCLSATDATDCAGLGTNDCHSAGDGRCDEPGIGQGVCAIGTDTADCRPVAAGGALQPPVAAPAQPTQPTQPQRDRPGIFGRPSPETPAEAAPAEEEASAPVPAADWAGVWETSVSRITMRQSGQLVRGEYPTDNGAIVGRVEGDRLLGYWIEDNAARTCDRPLEGRSHWGRVVFRLSADGQSFTGSWAYCDEDPEAASSGDWTGRRAGE